MLSDGAFVSRTLEENLPDVNFSESQGEGWLGPVLRTELGL